MYSLENVHALIIEDDQTSIDVLKNLLDQLAVNTSIIRVVNGRDVWDSLRVVAVPDVIFLDLEMPGMNGYEVLDLLREDEELGTVPVVAYTTHISHMNNARRAGFHSFLGKPVDRYEFSDNLVRILSGESVWEAP